MTGDTHRLSLRGANSDAAIPIIEGMFRGIAAVAMLLAMTAKRAMTPKRGYDTEAGQ
jgi:hypothetical protein